MFVLVYITDFDGMRYCMLDGIYGTLEEARNAMLDDMRREGKGGELDVREREGYVWDAYGECHQNWLILDEDYSCGEF